MTKDCTDHNLQNRRLERAARYVTDYWMPVNPALIKNLQQGLRTGRYDHDVSSLILEIKTDVSLFTHCLRRLLAMMQAGGQTIPSPLNPVQLLETCALDQLKAILESADASLSRHNLAEAEDIQVARFQEMMVSAAAVEALSKNHAVDPDTAYAAALLRQLGYALVAWNYPGAYEQALTTLTAGQSLDMALTMTLGFSPMLLAVRVLHQWGVSKESCSAFGLVEQNLEGEEDAESPEAIGYVMTKLCKIGEALGRANNPDLYPNAREDWRAAAAEIEARLGHQGMQLIREKYEENIENYVSFIPHILDTGLNLDALSYSQADQCDQLAAVNPYLPLCSRRVARKLRSIYRRLGSGTISAEVIRLLVHEAIPAAGFTAGCIYTVDPGVFMLVPQLQINQMQLRAAAPVAYSLVESESDLVAVAYQSDAPVQESRRNREGAETTGIAGMFGLAQPIGVLYLERLGTPRGPRREQIAAHFNAFRHTFNDCFSLA